jgi:hypothetical protein
LFSARTAVKRYQALEAKSSDMAESAGQSRYLPIDRARSIK